MKTVLGPLGEAHRERNKMPTIQSEKVRVLDEDDEESTTIGNKSVLETDSVKPSGKHNMSGFFLT